MTSVVVVTWTPLPLRRGWLRTGQMRHHARLSGALFAAFSAPAKRGRGAPEGWRGRAGRCGKGDLPPLRLGCAPPSRRDAPRTLPASQGRIRRSIPALIPACENGCILCLDLVARGGPWIRPRGRRKPSSVLRKRAWRGGVWSSGAAPVDPVRGRAEGGGMYSAYLVCAGRAGLPAPGWSGWMPENGPLPATGEPSKEGRNAPRGAPVPAPKRQSAPIHPTVLRAQSPALRHTPHLAPARRRAWRVFVRPPPQPPSS